MLANKRWQVSPNWNVSHPVNSTESVSGSGEYFQQSSDPIALHTLYYFSFTTSSFIILQCRFPHFTSGLTTLPPPRLSLSPLSLSLSVKWSRSWQRKAADAPSCPSSTDSTSTAASDAARPSPSCSTRSASAWTACTTSARPAAPTTRGTKPGCARRARRAG